MTNPPNRPRDDRRMHEGEKPGLSGKIERGDQEPVDLEQDDAQDTSSTSDREQESALGGDVATRSKA
jgi:hypothetical protein